MSEISKIPAVHGKYLSMMMREKLTKENYTQLFERVYQTRWEYYSGRAAPAIYKENPFPHKLLKGDLEMYLRADKEIQSIKQKLILQDAKVELLESIIKLINNRSFLIRDYIEWTKFTNGS